MFRLKIMLSVGILSGVILCGVSTTSAQSYGQCFGGESCTEPCPAANACFQDAHCPAGTKCAFCCAPDGNDFCAPSTCGCNPTTNQWGCTHDCNGECVRMIPAVSEWGLMIMVLLFLATGALCLRRTGRRVALAAALIFSSVAFTPRASHAATHMVSIPGEAQGNLAALGLTPRRHLEYGSFAWLELSSADLARLQASGLPYEVREEPYTLHLGGQSFDPLQNLPVLPTGWDSVRSDVADLHLVQFVGPTRAEWLDDLETRGLKIVQYIYPCTYVVWGTKAACDAAAAADVVRWTGPFAQAYRVLPQWRGLADAPREFNVLLYGGADTQSLVEAFETLGGQVGEPRVLDERFRVLGLTLSPNALQLAASVPGVYTIQPVPTDGGLRGEMSDQVCANNVVNNLASPGYLAWLAALNLSGSGVIMANVDNGVQNDHPDLINRMAPCVGVTCGGTTQQPHGTHTAGIMAADGSSGVLDDYGFLRGLGVAPGANLVELLCCTGTCIAGSTCSANAMLQLMTDSYRNGALISSNSWGPSIKPCGYDILTKQVDVGVRDADPDTPGNQSFTYVLAIENGDGGISMHGAPDEAKNIFTIGSTKMQFRTGAQNPAINDLSPTTAHGPACDGRNIPHMVAPGCEVDSSVTGSGHLLDCGTSMACPHVSGAIALFIQYYRSLCPALSNPSPALIKAVFTAVARPGRTPGRRRRDPGASLRQ